MKRQQVSFLHIEEQRAGQRLDNFLFAALKDIPKPAIYRLLRKGEIRVNKKRVRQSYRLLAGDIVRLPPLARAAGKEQAVSISAGLREKLLAGILYEDEQILALNKPSGMAVHGGDGVSLGLIEAMRKLRPDCAALELAHRLDKDTSGCLLMSKRRDVLLSLHAQFREKTAHKVYLALVSGKWPDNLRKITTPLQRTTLQSGERIVRARQSGKAAETNFKLQARYPQASLLEVQPVTGRTHQIRVHAQTAGYPVLGDNKYGNEQSDRLCEQLALRRLFLHAESLTIQLPGSAKPLTLRADLDDNLQQLLARMAQ